MNGPNDASSTDEQPTNGHRARGVNDRRADGRGHDAKQATVTSRRHGSDQLRLDRSGSAEPVDRWAAVGIGAAIVFTSGYIFPVFGQFVGGIVAGYLRGSNRTESVITGGLASALATFPGLLVAFGFVFFLFSPLADTGSMLTIFGIITFFYFGLVAIAGGIGAFGGIVGASVTNRSAP